MAPSEHDPKAQVILGAAKTILAKKGFIGTTINSVAKEAQVSRGLLHYYFKNKEEMLARVLKTNMETSILMITSIFESEKTAKGYSKAITSLLKNVMAADPDFFNLFFEGFAVARQSEIVSNELSVLYGNFRKALENCLILAKDEKIISPSLPVEALAAIITGIIDGMGLQLLTEPELSQNNIIWKSMEKSILNLLER